MPVAQDAQFDAGEQARFGAAFDALVATQSASEPSVHLDWMPSPVGPLVLGATDDAIVLLEFASADQLSVQLERLRKQLDRTLVRTADHALLQRLCAQLDEYFAGARREFSVPLEAHGSPFQESVWSALRGIPYGETCSYAAVARALGDPKSTRAVGMANGLNPIAIVIPCHRVVNANGELGGYGGGRWRKQVLLDLERGQRRLF